MTPLTYNSDLRNYARFLTRDSQKVDDLVQSTYLRAYSYLDHFDGRNMKAWLMTLMKNIYLNQLKKKTCVDFVEKYDYKQGSDNISPMIHSKEIEAQISRLPDRMKDTFNLFLSGYTYDEMSSMLGVHLGTVKTRIHNARKILMQIV